MTGAILSCNAGVFFGRVNAIAGIFDFQNRGRLGRVESATTINQDFGACASPENACIAGKRSLDLTVHLRWRCCQRQLTANSWLLSLFQNNNYAAICTRGS